MRHRLRIAVESLQRLRQKERVATAYVEQAVDRLYAQPHDEGPVALDSDSLQFGKGACTY